MKVLRNSLRTETFPTLVLLLSLLAPETRVNVSGKKTLQSCIFWKPPFTFSLMLTVTGCHFRVQYQLQNPAFNLGTCTLKEIHSVSVPVHRVRHRKLSVRKDIRCAIHFLLKSFLFFSFIFLSFYSCLHIYFPITSSVSNDLLSTSRIFCCPKQPSPNQSLMSKLTNNIFNTLPNPI